MKNIPKILHIIQAESEFRIWLVAAYPTVKSATKHLRNLLAFVKEHGNISNNPYDGLAIKADLDTVDYYIVSCDYFDIFNGAERFSKEQSIINSENICAEIREEEKQAELAYYKDWNERGLSEEEMSEIKEGQVTDEDEKEQNDGLV